MYHHVVDNTTPHTDSAREGSQLEGREISGIASRRKINEILGGVINRVICGLFRGGGIVGRARSTAESELGQQSAPEGEIGCQG
jgi:hypothetical protein